MKKYCYNCNKDVTYKEKMENTEYSYRNKSFLIREKKYYCTLCGNELEGNDLDDEVENIYNGYLKFYNLTRDSFLNIRKSLGLSQEMFALALGWSKKSVVRYENNEEIPSGEYLKTYMKLNQDKDYFGDLLWLNRVNLDDDIYYKIINKVKLNLDIKSRNVILYFLKDKTLYLGQLLKLLFAGDFWCFKNTGRTLTSFKYARLPFGPVVDKYNVVLNAMLKSGEITCENVLLQDGEKLKYKSEKEVDLGLFTDKEIEFMRDVKRKLGQKSAKELSLWSHEFIGWKETQMGKIINYEKYASDFVWN